MDDLEGVDDLTAGIILIARDLQRGFAQIYRRAYSLIEEA